jgi:hypothetical protein
MQYLLLCCFDEKRWESLPGSQREDIMHEYGQFVRRLDESGRHIASAQLLPSSAASTVRARNGRPIVTDGPFAETKEQLGGYHLIDCRDLDEALSIAQEIPTIAYGGAIEVRPLLPPRTEHLGGRTPQTTPADRAAGGR